MTSSTEGFSIRDPGGVDDRSQVFPGLRADTLVAALGCAPEGRLFTSVRRAGAAPVDLTFGQFRRKAASHAAFLRTNGIGAGDRVILVLPQSAELMTAFAGAMMLGATPAILAYPIHKMDPGKYRAGLADVSRRLNASVAVVDAAFPEDLRRHIDSAGGLRLIEIRDEATGEASPPGVGRSRDLALIQHSAGTTGLQKGVALTHEAILRQVRRLAEALALETTDRIYSWLPLYHDMGLIACFMLPLVCHLPVILHDPLDWVMQPASMLEVVTTERCTLAWMPNFAFQFLARRVRPSDREAFNLSSVRAFINCSEPVRASSIDEFLDAYRARGLRPASVITSYALAENVFAVTQSAPGEPPRRLNVDPDIFGREHRAQPVPDGSGGMTLVSSGRLLSGQRLRIVSSSGQALGDLEVGRIQIAGECLFEGYFNNPEATSAALVEGWYDTGDLGFTDRGELFVTGRSRDLIIVAGRNIYPHDVEEIVSSHPRVHDGRSVALGWLNPALGTEDLIVVAEVDDPDDLDLADAIERDLRERVSAELGIQVKAIHLKPPRWIVKSTAGKPARRDTLLKLTREHPELVPGESRV